MSFLTATGSSVSRARRTRPNAEVSASVPTDPTWTLTPVEAEWLRQIAGRLPVRFENDVVDDKSIALALYDCRVPPLNPARVISEEEVDDDLIPAIAQHLRRSKCERRRRPVGRARKDATIDERRFVDNLWDRRVRRRRVRKLPTEVRLTGLSIVDSLAKIFAQQRTQSFSRLRIQWESGNVVFDAERVEAGHERVGSRRGRLNQ